MKITNEMVNEFNSSLKIMGCCFKLKFVNDKYSEGNPSCEIIMFNDLFIDSFIINPTKKFYETLESYFLDKGITLSYNNTRSIFWSKSGWDIK